MYRHIPDCICFDLLGNIHYSVSDGALCRQYAFILGFDAPDPLIGNTQDRQHKAQAHVSGCSGRITTDNIGSIMVHVKSFIKSLFIQVMFSKRNMQGFGYGLFTGQWDMHINTNPYFASVLAGMMKRGADSSVMAPVIAMFADNFIWNHLKPIVLMGGLIMLFARCYWGLFILLCIYIAVTTWIRLAGYAYGVKKASTGSMLFNEWYFHLNLKIMRIIKYILMGAAFACIIALLLTYLKINPYYAILSILIILILIYRRYNNELIVSLIILIIYIIGI